MITNKIQKRRVALFIPSLSEGGAERVMINLAIGIANTENVCVDLVLVDRVGSRLHEIPDTIHIHSLESKRTITSLPALVRYLRKYRPDALISALDPANLVAIIAKYIAQVETRIIVTEHNTLSLKAKNPSKPRGRIIPWLVSLIYPLANGIVAVSSGVADDLAQVTGLQRSKIEVIYNPVINESMVEKSKLAVEHPWLQNPTVPTVLGVGRLSKPKNFSMLIKAIANVSQETPVRLIILGEGELRNELEQIIEDLHIQEIVDLPGFVDNPYAYMSRTSLFVLSSIWEGLPTVLIESLYCGTPVISTDCPSGPREILECGKYGKLIPVGDVDILTQAILDTLTTTRSAAAEKSKVSPESWQRFTTDYSVDRYLDYALG